MHVYRIAGMIASIRGKKPQIYRDIILKQMADHSIWVTPEQSNCRPLQMSINVQQEAFMFSCFRPTYRWQRPVKGISLISTHVKALRREILIWLFEKAMAFSRSKTISLVRSRFSQWEVSTPFEPIYEHQQRTFDFVNNSLNFVH